MPATFIDRIRKAFSHNRLGAAIGSWGNGIARRGNAEQLPFFPLDPPLDLDLRFPLEASEVAGAEWTNSHIPDEQTNVLKHPGSRHAPDWREMR